jgi:hypothetical protein
LLTEASRMRVSFFNRPASAFALLSLVLSLLLSGCSSPGASLMDARAEVSSPVKGGFYLPVGVTPPPREQPTMTADEQARLRNELTTAQRRQALAVKARDRDDR